MTAGPVWMKQFDEKYCKNCADVIAEYEGDSLMHLNKKSVFSYCEVYNKCKYFQEMDELPSASDILSIWLDLPHNENVEVAE